MIKSVNVLFLTLLVSSGWASAQSTTTGGISESTDSARATEVERKVEELSGQSATGSSATGTQERSSSGAKKKSERKSESGQENEGSSQSSGGASGATGESGAAQTTPQDEATPESGAAGGSTSGTQQSAPQSGQ